MAGAVAKDAASSLAGIRETETPASVPVDLIHGLTENEHPESGTYDIMFFTLSKDVNEDPGEDVALLSVSFEDTEATQVYPKLYLSPRIEQ